MSVRGECIDRAPRGAGTELALVCVPYAGAGAGVFRRWDGGLGPNIRLLPCRLPGRESRFGEPAHVRMQPLVTEICDALDAARVGHYALFGHSMGALVVFELVRELRRRGRAMPRRMILSGHRPPDEASPRPQLHDAPDAVFVDELRRLGGMPDAILDEPELLTLLMPRLKADFAVCETYRYTEEEPLCCQVEVWGGRSDPAVSATDLHGWARQFSAPPVVRLFEGGHFFIDDDRDRVLDVLRMTLQALAPAEAADVRHG